MIARRHPHSYDHTLRTMVLWSLAVLVPILLAAVYGHG